MIMLLYQFLDLLITLLKQTFLTQRWCHSLYSHAQSTAHQVEEVLQNILKSFIRMYPSTLYGDDFIRLTSKPILVEIKKNGRPR